MSYYHLGWYDDRKSLTELLRDKSEKLIIDLELHENANLSTYEKIITTDERTNFMGATTTFLSKNRIGQGEIYYISPYGETPDSDTFYGGRPAVIVSTDMINEFSGCVEIAFLTTNPHDTLPTNVKINATTKKSWVICAEITNISKRRIGKYVGKCSDAEFENIKKAIALSTSSDIIDRKEIKDILTAWQESLQNNFSEDAVQDRDLDAVTDNTVIDESASCEQKPVIEPVAQTEEPKPETPEPVIRDITQEPEYIKLAAERDMLKLMYDNLMKTVLNK